MDEFALIRRIVDELGEQARGDWVSVGAGDDAAVITPSTQCDQVASIDALVEGVHFPLQAPGELTGYRAMMVSLSDLAAMAAVPRYVLVGLTLMKDDEDWAVSLARGIRLAAQQTGVVVVGGNLAQGHRQISISVHGEVPEGAAVLRNGAVPGQRVMVSGELGGAAACVRLQDFAVSNALGDVGALTVLQEAYYRPQARFDLVPLLRDHATAAVDVSDGLLRDVMHIAQASGVGVRLNSGSVPVCAQAQLDDALRGGDDYQVVCTAGQTLPGMTVIGEVVAEPGLILDGQTLSEQQVLDGGYNHFSH